MKNFRKVLALVLVVAMMFSFTAMSSAAYKDASKVSYKEAVDVLSAIGILNGYEVAKDEYEFQPTAEIDRDEMAKMIAVLANAGDDVSELYAVGTKFADVAKSHWAASYVAYCASEGIVNGRSATTFDPDASVTALETAKMLLVVLGFDGAEQGYTGANWKTNVLTDAKLMGLFDGFPAKYNVDANITRELAAQMMLNALQAPCVAGILSDGIVKVTNGLIYGGLKIDLSSKDVVKLSGYATLKDAMETGSWCMYGNVVISNDTLYKTLFNGLKKGAGYDCFGRPSIVWTKGSTTIGTYPVAAAKKYTTTATIVDDFKVKATDAITLVADGNYISDMSVANAVEASGKGVLTEVYKVDGKLHVVVINTWISKIASVNNRTGKAKVVGFDGVEFKNAAGFKVGDVVLFKVCNGEATTTLSALNGGSLHEVVAAEAQQLKVEETWTNKAKETDKSWIVAGGEKFEYAKNLGHLIAPIVKPNADGSDKGWIDTNYIVSALADNAKLYFYTDEYGYIIHWGEYVAAPSYEYAYVIENSTFANDPSWKDGKETNDANVTYKYYGDMVNFETEKSDDVRINKAMYQLDKDNKFGMLVKYEVKSGVATLVETAQRTAESISKTGKIGGLNVWCDDATNFLVRTWDYDNAAYVYTDYVGFDNLPSGLKSYVYNNEGTLQYFVDEDGEGDRATYVFIDAYYATAADYFVVLDDTNEVSVSKFDKLVEAMTCYTALVNGEESYVFSTMALTSKELVKADVKTLTATFQGKPIYIAKDPTVVPDTDLTAVETLKVVNGTITTNDTTANGWRYDDETKVILIVTNTTDKLSDDYVVLEGIDEIEGFDGYTGYDFGMAKAFVTSNVLDTLYVWATLVP